MGSNLANRTDSPSRRLIALSDEAIRGDRRNPASSSFRSAPRRCPGRVRACVPTIMMFVQSLHGISHNKREDTKEEHLELAEQAMQWIATR